MAADGLSFARAAARAGVKQATLSKRVTLLEDQLGLKLFERSTKGAVPTEAGLRFIESARRVLTDLDALQASGRAYGSGQTGTLGLGFSTSLSAGHMRGLIGELIGRFPDLRLTCLEGSRRRLAQALHSGAVDFAVTSGDLREIGLQGRSLWSERVMVAVHDQHALASRERIYWTDLRSERFVLPLQEPGGDLADLVRARLTEPAWRPDVETQEVSRENVLSIVPLGRFVTLTTGATLTRSIPGVTLRDIHDLAGHITHIAYTGFWRVDNSSSTLAGLLKLIDDRFPR